MLSCTQQSYLPMPALTESATKTICHLPLLLGDILTLLIVFILFVPVNNLSVMLGGFSSVEPGQNAVPLLRFNPQPLNFGLNTLPISHHTPRSHLRTADLNLDCFSSTELIHFCILLLIPPLFFVLKMSSAFNICSLHPNAHQTRFFSWEQTI